VEITQQEHIPVVSTGPLLAEFSLVRQSPN